MSRLFQMFGWGDFQSLVRCTTRLTAPSSCLSSHCSGPNRGHYITIVKSHGFWLLFDDDIVEVRLTFSSLLSSVAALV